MLRLSHELRENCSVLLGISIGNAKQTGTEFTEIVNLIEKTKQIRRGAIMLTGALQRHNIRATQAIGDDEALQLAFAAEQQWLNENNEALQRLLNLNFHIIKWEKLITVEEYPIYRDKIQKLFDANAKFRRDVNGLATAFSKIYANNGIIIPKERLIHLQEYILEESAVAPYMSMSNDLAFDYVLYRGKPNAPVQRANKKFGFTHHMLFISILANDDGQNSKIIDNKQNPSIINDEYHNAANILVRSFLNKLTPVQKEDFINSLACFCAQFNDNLKKTLTEHEEHAK